MAHILVVDDEESIRELIKMVLERDGHAVDAAGGGREALEALGRGRYDLVILDRSMPGIGGVEVLREMAKDPALRGVKAIMCTAAGMMNDVDEALSAGAVDYVVKPLDIAVLSQKVARHAAGARVSSASVSPADGAGFFGALLGRLRSLLP